MFSTYWEEKEKKQYCSRYHNMSLAHPIILYTAWMKAKKIKKNDVLVFILCKYDPTDYCLIIPVEKQNKSRILCMNIVIISVWK